MAEYEFADCDNPRCPNQEGKAHLRVIYVLSYLLGKAPPVGTQVPCPCCKAGKITRIFSLPHLRIKAGQLPEFRHGQSYLANLNGRNTKITFVDHPQDNDENHMAQMAQVAQRQGIRGAYYSAKHGRLCVDVASSVPDPLGRMPRGGGGTRHREVTRVNTPVRVPVKKTGRRPISRKSKLPPALIPIRR